MVLSNETGSRAQSFRRVPSFVRTDRGERSIESRSDRRGTGCVGGGRGDRIDPGSETVDPSPGVDAMPHRIPPQTRHVDRSVQVTNLP